MRIGVDARMLFMSGIGTYLRNLIAGLRRIGAGHEYVLLLRRADMARFPRPGPNFTLVEAEAPPYSLAEQVRLARLVRRLGLDVIHHPHYFAPAFGATPLVVTIHDLIHQLFPELCPSLVHWRVAWAMARRSARRARVILAVSGSTRRDIVKHLGVPEEKVRLTYNALPPGWGEGPGGPLPEAIAALRGAPYFLYVGNHKAHKNLPLLLEAYAGLRRRRTWARLVMTGERAALEEHLARLGLEEEVVFLGHVPNEALEAVYRAAVALVFPSSYEGFGYPPLEAMGCGTPAVVSQAPALAEVVGEGGVAVPVNDPGALEGAMRRMLEDPSHRAELARRASERAKRFSWRALAEGTLRAYAEAAEAGAAGAAGMDGAAGSEGRGT